MTPVILNNNEESRHKVLHPLRFARSFARLRMTEKEYLFNGLVPHIAGLPAGRRAGCGTDLTILIYPRHFVIY